MSKLVSGNKILSSVHDEFYGRLMKAESSTSGEQFWFRMLYEKYAKYPQLLSGFFNIAEKSLPLKHFAIPRVIRPGSEDDINYIVMDPFLGEALSQIIISSKKFKVERALRIIVQVCQALQYAKLAGTNHGCLTADSVFINANNEIAVINFGCEKFFDFMIHDLREKSALEYARYLSPLRLRRQAETSNGDLYSIGILLFYMLTGQLPFETERLFDLIRQKEKYVPSAREINPEISVGLENIVSRLLDPNSAEQFHSITQLVRILAPETIRHEALPDPNFVNVPVTIREKYQNYIDHLPPIFQMLVPTWVGSKRRAAISISIIASVLLLAVMVIVYSQINGGESQNKDAVFQEYLSQIETKDKPTQDLKVQPKARNSMDPVAFEPEPQMPIKEADAEEEDTGILVDESMSTDFEQGPVITQMPEELVDAQEMPIEDNITEAFVLKVGMQGYLLEANVFVDETKIGITDANGVIEIDSIVTGKTFRFRIEKNGFKTWEKRIRIDEQNQFGVYIELQPKPDALRRFTLREVGFADRVIIDNKLPSHKLPCELDLTPGVHQFKYIESKSMFTKDTTILLGMETSNEIFIDSKSMGTGLMSVVVQNAISVGYVYVSVDGAEKLSATPLRLNLPVGRHRLIFSRDGYTTIPKDTTVIILPNREVTVRCRLDKNS
jgi:serine/threonine protein kinase